MFSQKNKLNILLLFIPLFFCQLSSYAQTRDTVMEDSLIKLYNKEGVTPKTSIETLTYIHFQAVEGNIKEHSAVFYYDESGSYACKASISYSSENVIEMVSNLNSNYSRCMLEDEVQLERLDVNWIKKKLLENSDKDQANYIYYNEEEKAGVFRTYKLY